MHSVEDRIKAVRAMQPFGGATVRGMNAARAALASPALSKPTLRRWWKQFKDDARAAADPAAPPPEPEPPADPELSPKQRIFITEYLRTLNGTEAAMIAYDCKDRVVASAIASENLRKPYLRRVIDAELDVRTLTSAEILYRLSEFATGSIEDVADLRADGTWQVNLTKAHRRGKLHLIHKLTEKRRSDADGSSESIFTVELYDAHAALRDLGRHRQLFNDKIELAIPKEVAEMLSKYNIPMTQFFTVFQKLLERTAGANAEH